MGKPRRILVGVTMRALIQRIDRRLKKEGRKLKATRSPRDVPSLGDYYIVDLNLNAVVGDNIDPEALGRDLGVLSKWEKVEYGA